MTMNEGQTPILKLVQRADQRAEQVEADIPRAGPPVEGENPFADVRGASDFHRTIEAAKDALWKPDWRSDQEKAQEPPTLRLVEGDRVLAEATVDDIRAIARERIKEVGSPEIRVRIGSLHSASEETLAFADVRTLAERRIAEVNAAGGAKSLAA